MNGSSSAGGFCFGAKSRGRRHAVSCDCIYTGDAGWHTAPGGIHWRCFLYVALPFSLFAVVCGYKIVPSGVVFTARHPLPIWTGQYVGGGGIKPASPRRGGNWQRTDRSVLRRQRFYWTRPEDCPIIQIIWAFCPQRSAVCYVRYHCCHCHPGCPRRTGGDPPVRRGGAGGSCPGIPSGRSCSHSRPVGGLYRRLWACLRCRGGYRRVRAVGVSGAPQLYR